MIAEGKSKKKSVSSTADFFYFVFLKCVMLKNYFNKLTLFAILAFFCLTASVITAIAHQPEEIKSPLLYDLLMAAVALIAIDILLKQVLKLKTIWLWVIEVFLLIVALYIWIIT